VKLSVQLPTDRVLGGELTSADVVSGLAAAIEAAGFDACWVTEHPFPSDAWLASGGHHSLDPFVVLSAAAVATRRLRLHTNVLVLPYRNPFLAAKAVASLDVLSGGRVILGVAPGYLQAEHEALGADFAARGELTDEALVAMKRAWTGRSVVAEGRTFSATGNTMLPVPAQQPHPPIWIGGNTKAAIRRAVHHAQGWSPFPQAAKHASVTRTAAIESVSDLAARIGYLREYAASVGRREPLDVNFVPFGYAMGSRRALDPVALRAQVAELEAIGVTWLTLALPGSSRGEVHAALGRLADALLV